MRLVKPEGEQADRCGRTLVTTAVLCGRAGLLHTAGGSKRCGVEVDLESGELSIPECPQVYLVIGDGAAGIPNRRLGVHQGYDLVVLGDELSWLERREVETRCQTTKPA